ncbi:hypothetical protein BGX26_000056 [Mortierella sp. AD094]|nr:hypothetical protein BGX26_000056 [Mortierella sp. AD094]
MDNPINGDKYIRTLSHYLRSNQRRLLPPTLNSTPENSTTNQLVSSAAASNARSFVTPADPMAAAYQSMIDSLWNATTAVVGSITPVSLSGNNGDSQEQENDNGSSWDGTSAILPEKSPSETQLYLQAQLRSPIFPLDLYYLLYLLERFEQVGIDLEGWEGTTTRTVGDSTPRVILPSAAAAGNGITNLLPKGNANRPQSIRSFSSTAVSTLTLITGWKQWSTAASFNSSNLTLTDDIHFIRKVLKNIPSLRLVAKIPPGDHVQGKGRIEGFNADAILTLFSHGQSLELNGEDPNNKNSSMLFLPLPAIFTSLTHLELHKIPPNCIEGWETLMERLRSLVIIQSGIEDVYDVIVTTVVNSEKRRRQRISREKSRAVQIKEEQQEALKDAVLTTQELEGASTAPTAADSENDESQNAEGLNGSLALDLDDTIVLSSLKMWPALRHLSFSDNSLPSLTHNDTFSYTKSITSLDLSRNLFLSPPSGLIHLHNLNDLDLSYNMISGVQSIYQVLGNISVLSLRGNRLESLSGLERLWNLEKVDVRENHLDEAAEVGRLAALPGIREVWSERNPFCTTQPKYRLEILAVFKANGHELLLDGTFASFIEKRALSNLSPSSFTTTISSINNVANIPAASAPVATFAQELTHSHHSQNHSRTQSAVEEALNATSKVTSGAGPTSPISKLTKKKLVKSTKRVKRVVNLDSDHEGEHENENPAAPADMDVKELDGSHDDEVAAVTAKVHQGVLGYPAKVVVKKKKKKNGKTTSPSQTTVDSSALVESNGHHDHAQHNHGNHGEDATNKPKKRVTRKESAGMANVSFAEGNKDQDPDVDHSLCHDGHHVHKHRLAHLENSIAALHLERPSAHQREPSRGILKRNSTMPASTTTHSGAIIPSGAISPRLRPSSPIGSFSSDDGGADGYRRRIEAMRNEAGKNWLMVLAEMDTESTVRDPSSL